MGSQIFYAGRAMGHKLQAQALVAKDGFSARYDLDRIKGVFSRPEHKLAGESYVGKILILNVAKGGVATAWMLYEMVEREWPASPAEMQAFFAHGMLCNVIAAMQIGDLHERWAEVLTTAEEECR